MQARAEDAGRPQFLGVLESPLDDGLPLLGEQIEVRGWALGSDAVDEVRADFASLPGRCLHVGIARPDVESAFEGSPNASHCGFAGRLDIPKRVQGAQWLVVTAQAAGRQVHQWHRQVFVGDIDVAYRQWRQRADLLTQPAQRRPRLVTPGGAPLGTWVVCATAADDGDLAEATAAEIRREGRGYWDAVVARAASDGSVSWPARPITTAYLGLLQAGDRIAPQAADWVRAGLPDLPAPDLIYADHDHIGPGHDPHDPVFKPGWSPLLRSHPDVISRGWVVRRELFDETGWPALQAQPGSALRLPPEVAARCHNTWHVAWPMFSLGSNSLQIPVPSTAAAPASKLTVIVPSRLANRTQLARCLDGVRQEGLADAEVMVVLNNLQDTSEAEAREFLRPWSARSMHVAGPFNWSRLNNLAAGAADGDLLLFLNDDVEPLQPGWVHAMLSLLVQTPELGVVGAVLRYADGSIQHAGIQVHGGSSPQCRHTFRHCTGLEARVHRWLSRDRAQTAVTGACLLTPRSAFDGIGGFDESLAVVYNDVDYCLRLGQRGLGCAVAAGAQLRHHEGMSRGGIAEDADRLHFRARWAAALPECDPHSHPGLVRERDDWMFDATRWPQAPIWIP